MKRHFIAQALGKANGIWTDIAYKSLAVSHPAFTLCSAVEERHAIREPGIRKKIKKEYAFLSPRERQLQWRPNHPIIALINKYLEPPEIDWIIITPSEA